LRHGGRYKQRLTFFMFHQISRTTSLALSITVPLELSRTLVLWRRWRSELSGVYTVIHVRRTYIIV